MKRVKIVGRSIPVLAIVVLVASAGLVSAALVSYLSNTVTKPVEVRSPIELSGEITYTLSEIGPIVVTEDFDGELLGAPLYAGSEFDMTFWATSLTNTPIEYELVMVLEGPEGAWTPYDEIDEFDGYCAADYIWEVEIDPYEVPPGIFIKEGGEYALVPLLTGGIGPGETQELDVWMYVYPEVKPDNYKFHVLAVPDPEVMVDYYIDYYYMETGEFLDVDAAFVMYLDGIIDQTKPQP